MYRVEQGIGYIKLDRTEKRNALNTDLVNKIRNSIRELITRNVFVAVIEAEPPVFCAGGDIFEFPDHLEESVIFDLFDTLVSSPIFFIAAVDGDAIGAGLALIAVCPVAILSEDARFWLPERSGQSFFPGGVLPYIEPHIGPRRAIHLAMNEPRLTAAEVVGMGLANEVVPKFALKKRITEIATDLASTEQVTKAATEVWQASYKSPNFVRRRDEYLAAISAGWNASAVSAQNTTEAQSEQTP